MKIEVLYSEVCNLYGDLANVRYLKACRPELTIVETDLHTKPRFLDEDIALVFLGSTTEQGLKLATEALLPWREAIAAKIDAGQRFLAVGNAVDMLTEGIRSDGGLAESKRDVIEGMAADIIDELQSQGLTQAACGDLEKHAYSVNDGIADGGVRNLHILSAV